MAVNWPFTGSESAIPVGTSVTDPCAQLGTQLFQPDTPSAVALVAVQEVQSMSVTTFPLSPLMAIISGFLPE